MYRLFDFDQITRATKVEPSALLLRAASLQTPSDAVTDDPVAQLDVLLCRVLVRRGSAAGSDSGQYHDREHGVSEHGEVAMMCLRL